MSNNRYNDVTLAAGETINVTWDVYSRDMTMFGILFLSEDGTTTYNGMHLGFTAYNNETK